MLALACGLLSINERVCQKKKGRGNQGNTDENRTQKREMTENQTPLSPPRTGPVSFFNYVCVSVSPLSCFTRLFPKPYGAASDLSSAVVPLSTAT